MPDDARVDARAARGVIPFVGMNGKAGEAADFYVRAFAAKELSRMAGEDDPTQLMLCHLEVNGGGLMMSDMRAPDTPATAPQGFHLQLVVEDGDLWWNRAVEAGCTVVMPFEKMFWGDRWGMLTDPFGLTWAIDEPAA